MRKRRAVPRDTTGRPLRRPLVGYIVVALFGAGVAAVTTASLTDVTTTTSVTTVAKVPATCRYRDDGALPDPLCTPGAVNPDVTPATLATTICKRGWTATIRPPQSVTGPEKRWSMRQYGVTGVGGYEYDHLISLELGGAANDPRNLWPEPHAAGAGDGSFAKDKVENKLKAKVCAGTIPLEQAQRTIATDWRAAR